MTADDEKAEHVERLIGTPDLADALESEQFRRFLDQIPIAIVVAEIKDKERIVYANPEFERLSGQSAAEIEGKPWSVLRGAASDDDTYLLAEAIIAATEAVGTFRIAHDGGEATFVDAYSNLIEDDDGTPAYRLAALVEMRAPSAADGESLRQRLREKDTLLREIQHRVKNNLQMITALIRLEARNAPDPSAAAPLSRLAGRIEALHLLYRSLEDAGEAQEIDLGVYLSEVAAAVMHAHATEGIRLDLKVDTWPVSVNVAMPAGLVVNELLTNALKHAFAGRERGTVILHSLTDADGCRVVVADDGVGLPAGVEWPQRGKLGSLIVQSLRENARASLAVDSQPGQGTRITIVFSRAAAAPEPTG